MRCAVYYCSNNNKNKNKNFRFYCFPKDSVLLKKWVHFCKRKDNFNVKTARICSDHFTPGDIERNLRYKIGFCKNNAFKLKENTIPSVFSLLLDLKKIEASNIREKRNESRNTKKSIMSILKETLATDQHIDQCENDLEISHENSKSLDQENIILNEIMKSCSGEVKCTKHINKHIKIQKQEPVPTPPPECNHTYAESGEHKYENSDPDPDISQSVSDTEYDDTASDLQNFAVEPPEKKPKNSPAYDENITDMHVEQFPIEPEEKTQKLSKIKIERVESKSVSVSPNFNCLPSTSTRIHYSENELLDLAVAKFFYACQIPFETADSIIFKEFVKVLRSGSYKPPTSEYLATSLLGKVHDELFSQQLKSMKKESILLIDSQDNPVTNTKKAVSLLLSENGTKTFLDSHDFSMGHESKEDFVEIIRSSSELAKQKFKTNIFAAVTNLEDGESTTNIWHNSCSYYCGNLLAQDITEKDIAVKVNNLLIDFKQSRNEKSLLEYGGRKIVLPSKANWSSYCDAFECVLDNLEQMKQIATDGNFNGKPRIEFMHKRLLFSNEFIENIKLHLARLNPICDLVQKCQSTKFTLADATEHWLSIDLGDEFQDSLKIIRNGALKKYALAANILHPLYRGGKLSNEQREEGEIFIFDEVDASGLDDYQSFCSNSSNIFKALAHKKEVTPKTFWCLANRKHPSLSNLALKLLQIPAASQETKILQMVNTDLRDNLDAKAVKKLQFIQYSLSCV